MEISEKLIKKTFKNPCNIHRVKYYMKLKDLDEAQKVIFKLLNDNIIEESHYAKEYYCLKEK